MISQRLTFDAMIAFLYSLHIHLGNIVTCYLFLIQKC